MNTPRTDAMVAAAGEVINTDCAEYLGISNLSRTLERELAVSERERREWQSAAQSTGRELSAKSAECQAQAATIARLREALETIALRATGTDPLFRMTQVRKTARAAPQETQP